MLALQSRMSPHFLYNTIANISIMAEDGQSGNVVNSCALLTSMLRYITVPNSAQSTLKGELDYTRQYLELMQLRFMGKIRFDIHLPQEMEALPCRKLLIQPLAENAVKHSYNRDPPWEVLIRGRITDRRIASKEFLLRAPELNLGGMGLANIAARLILEYGPGAHIEVENRPDEGALVKIGVVRDL